MIYYYVIEDYVGSTVKYIQINTTSILLKTLYIDHLWFYKTKIIAERNIWHTQAKIIQIMCLLMWLTNIPLNVHVSPQFSAISMNKG